MQNQPLFRLASIAVYSLTTFGLAACGGDSHDNSVDPPVSDATKAILESDPASYASLSPVDAAGFKLVGRLKTRSTAQLKAQGLTNTLMIGGETTDRNFSTFANWKEFLNPLGTAKVRIQSGWNDIEQTITTPATYNFSKLDEIVNGATAQKVEPLIFLGYGNVRPGCVDCGTANLGGSFPTGAGKDRFLKFVEATVSRYKDKVHDWQIWNEPTKDLEKYEALIVDTAKVIKAVQPDAKIMIGTWYTVHYALYCVENCGANAQNQDVRDYILQSLKYFNDNKGPTVPSSDVYVGFHPYTTSVDYDHVPAYNVSMSNFLSLLQKYGFKARMDENGAPSTPCQTYALCNQGTLAWTEKNQVKYNLRRVLGDLARGIETSMFTITDLHYDDAKNTKGLLSTGDWTPKVNVPFVNGDQRVKGKKLAYNAFQNVTALFDNRMSPYPNHGCTVPAGYTVHAWRQHTQTRDATVLAVWKMTTLPVSDAAEPRAPIQVTCTGIGFSETPRYVDMMDGRVYEMPASTTQTNASTTFSVPVADWPVLVVDSSVVAGNVR